MPAQTTTAPLAVARRAAGTSSARRGEDKRCIEPRRWHSRRISRPLGTELHCKGLSNRITLACKCVDHLAAVDGKLCNDVRCGAKPVNAEPLRVSSQLPRPVPDQARAKQGCSFGLAMSFQKKAVALVGNRQFCIAAIDVIPREASAVAKILPPRLAVAACAASPAQPRHTDLVTGLEAFNQRAGRNDFANDLVPRYHR